MVPDVIQKRFKLVSFTWQLLLWVLQIGRDMIFRNCPLNRVLLRYDQLIRCANQNKLETNKQNIDPKCENYPL